MITSLGRTVIKLVRECLSFFKWEEMEVEGGIKQFKIKKGMFHFFFRSHLFAAEALLAGGLQDNFGRLLRLCRGVLAGRVQLRHVRLAARSLPRRPE